MSIDFVLHYLPFNKKRRSVNLRQLSLTYFCVILVLNYRAFAYDT